MEKEVFQRLVRQRGEELFRDMPWRHTDDPYAIMVSEIMLQQTQVDRVVLKYLAFMTRFPTVQNLADATLAEVLTLWSGLGYNRRAKFLHQAARKIVDDFGGQIPHTRQQLESLPGVGANTAGAILAYAFNQPAVFIETNVRTVYFYHFYGNGDLVDDKALRVLVEETLNEESPREWYWALMDYGAWLKSQGLGQLDKSRHYRKQSALKGSLRETRGAILRELTAQKMKEGALRARVGMEDRFDRALLNLRDEGLVVRKGDYLSLP